jgi:alanine racemase
VLIGGQRVPIVGRVCMDMTMVDVTRVPDVRVGDEAVLIGRQGAEEITAEEIAALTGTISYEVLCRVGARVPRVYRAAEFPRAPAEPS